MATTKPNNIMQKLAKARLMFLNEHVKKSGKNFKLEFTYFELKDIVPSATRIFDELGIATVVNFNHEIATMLVMNADNPDEDPMMFNIPYKEAPVIISNAGKEVTNPLQALGATITYLRRYLYMLVLDIVEDDETDGNLEETKPAPAKKPATAADRKKAKEKLTAPAPKTPDMASAEQMDHLKELCKTIIQKDESKSELVAQIGLKSDGFKTLSMDIYRPLLEQVEGIVKEYEVE